MTLLLGFQTFADGVGFFFLWVGCMFLSILFHDFGHITMGRFFGRKGKIVLYSFGGLTIGDHPAPHRWQRLAISLAGPAAGFLMYGIVLLVKDHLLSRIPLQFLIQNPGLVKVIDKGTAMLFGINLVWSLLNLVPIMPLDGGDVSQELFSAVAPRNGLRLSLYLSIFLALLAAGYCLFAWSQKLQLPYNLHGGLTALLLGLLAFDCFLMLRAENKRIGEEDAWIRENEGRF